MAFHQFGRLPIEIRHLIWDESLPAEGDAPTIYIYSPLLFLAILDPDGEDELYHNIGLDDRQPLVQARMPPQFHVSSEARTAALKWAKTNGMKLRLRDETQGHILVRPFDPTRDALYVPRDAWEHFLDALSEDGDTIQAVVSTIRHLALPAFTAYYSISDIGGIVMQLLTSIKTLSSVWGPLPEIRRARSGIERRPNGHASRLLANNTTTDDDGTDTGQDRRRRRDDDPGDIEVPLAQVQPRWELEEESAEMVAMCISDPLDGSISWEEGEREEWMEEMISAFMITEVPDHIYDGEADAFLTEFPANKAVLRDGSKNEDSWWAKNMPPMLAVREPDNDAEED